MKSGSLEPVAEEFSWQHPDPSFKLPKLNENGLTPGNGTLLLSYKPAISFNSPMNMNIDSYSHGIESCRSSGRDWTNTNTKASDRKSAA